MSVELLVLSCSLYPKEFKFFSVIFVGGFQLDQIHNTNKISFPLFSYDLGFEEFYIPFK